MVMFVNYIQVSFDIYIHNKYDIFSNDLINDEKEYIVLSNSDSRRQWLGKIVNGKSNLIFSSNFTEVEIVGVVFINEIVEKHGNYLCSYTPIGNHDIKEKDIEMYSDLLSRVYRRNFTDISDWSDNVLKCFRYIKKYIDDSLDKHTLFYKIFFIMYGSRSENVARYISYNKVAREALKEFYKNVAKDTILNRKKNSMSDLKKASSKAAKKGVGGDVAVGRAQKSQQKRRLAKGQPLNKRPPLPEGN